MFEATVDRPFTRRGLGRKGRAIYVLFCWVVCICLTALFANLSRSEAAIAQREHIVTGSVTEILKGKNERANYFFTYGSRTYSGQDSGSYLGLSVGDGVKVFVDPDSPTTNGLRSFNFESRLHHDCMVFTFWVSVVLSIPTFLLWAGIFVKRSSEQED